MTVTRKISRPPTRRATRLPGCVTATSGGGDPGNPLPALASDTEEYEFDIGDPPWTGTIPDPAVAVDLLLFSLTETAVTGAIPSFEDNTALESFTLDDCDGLTGDTPLFSTVASGFVLNIVNCALLAGNIASIPEGCTVFSAGDGTPLTGYTAGAFPTSLVELYAADAALTLTAVNAIVDAAFAASWATGNTLTINGGTSATPDAAQIVKIDAMILAGATILYNA